MDRNERLHEKLKLKKKRLVDSLVLNDILKDKRLAKAFMDVPLEKFIPEKFFSIVKLYEDVPNLFYYDEQNPNNYRTISAPHMISIMLQGLSLSNDDDLLILGAKSGYIAALAHKLAPRGKIVILEANSKIANITRDNLNNQNLDGEIEVIVKNPLEGFPELSPWQKILVTGGFGFVGLNLVANMIKNEVNPIILDFLPNRKENDSAHFPFNMDNLQFYNFYRVYQTQAILHNCLELE